MEKSEFDMSIQVLPELDKWRLSIILSKVCLEGEIPEELKVTNKNITEPNVRNKHIRSIIRMLENSIVE